jgi:hypothetical protein
MNPINLQVTFIDETSVECSAIAADLIAFESRFDLSVARLGDDVRLDAYVLPGVARFEAYRADH